MTDVLIIGAGIAGLIAALKASENGASVLLLTKTARTEGGSTNLAQGGIATVTEADDSFDSHIEDTLEAGAGLCKKDRVRILTQMGPETIQTLIQWGVRFSKSSDQFHLALEGGHSHRRILHADDLTGREIMRALLEKVAQQPRIQFKDNLKVLDLIVQTDGEHSRCIGAWLIHTQTGKIHCQLAKTTILATGGAGKLWLHSTNPPGATGDGIALAYRAGATLEDLEFMQFHPTSLYNPESKDTFLISEAVRGFGGILKNHEGFEFMNGIHPLRSLAPRDVVARAIHMEMERTGKPNMWLDLTHRSGKDIRTHFPNIYQHCRSLGIHMETDWIPVVPAAHYMCGGVRVDSWSRSDITHLYAVGECAATGVHGANRLASNSLLESVVYALRACRKIHSSLSNIELPSKPCQRSLKSLKLDASPEVLQIRKKIQLLLWTHCGMVRSLSSLNAGLEKMLVLQQELKQYPVNNLCVHEAKEACLAARLILQNALMRRESRGLHFLLDHPQRRTSQLKHYGQSLANAEDHDGKSIHELLTRLPQKLRL